MEFRNPTYVGTYPELVDVNFFDLQQVLPLQMALCVTLESFI